MSNIRRFCVMSDTHTDTTIMGSIISKYAGVVDYWFHCGDSELPLELIAKNFVGVRGNCDYYAGLPITRDVRFPFGVVHLEHGNRYGGVTDDYIRSLGCKYFLSGHTHKKLERVLDGDIYQFNPGSLVRPRDGMFGSFLFLDVDFDDGRLVKSQFKLVDPVTGIEIPD